MQKYYFHATAAIKQTKSKSFNAFNNWNAHYDDNCQICDTIKLLSERVIRLQKISKNEQKTFWWPSNF